MTIRNDLQPLKAGDTRSYRVRLALPNGDPYDMTGGSARFVITKSERSLATLVSKSAALTSADEGGKTYWFATASLVPADTQDIDPGNYYHAMRVKDASGRQFTVQDGQITIDPSPVPSF
jgi:hypothetical protein